MKHIAVVVSTKDPAGLNVKKNLIDNYQFIKTNKIFRADKIYKNTLIDGAIINLYTTEINSVHNENIDKEIDADIFIFATKHESASKKKSLTVHSPGNWSNADFGGKNNRLCLAPSLYLKTAFNQLLDNNTLSDYEVIQEVTHHGPYLEKPCMFIEIGSELVSWQNNDAGNIIAKTIVDTIQKVHNNIVSFESAVGIGGLHHAPNFKKIMQNSNYSVSHICPKYMLEHLTKDLVLQALDKSVPVGKTIILDYKGLKEHKQKVKDLVAQIQETNYEIKVLRTTDF